MQLVSQQIWNLSANATSQGIIKVKLQTKPKMLQAWQAYQALTYETKWKPDVDTAWNDYKLAWASKNPNEKTPKNRFQIMIEFMKEKYAEETNKMKEHCEVYVKELYVASLKSMNNFGQTNAEFQS